MSAEGSSSSNSGGVQQFFEGVLSLNLVCYEQTIIESSRRRQQLQDTNRKLGQFEVQLRDPIQLAPDREYFVCLRGITLKTSFLNVLTSDMFFKIRKRDQSEWTYCSFASSFHCTSVHILVAELNKIVPDDCAVKFSFENDRVGCLVPEPWVLDLSLQLSHMLGYAYLSEFTASSKIQCAAYPSSLLNTCVRLYLTSESLVKAVPLAGTNRFVSLIRTFAVDEQQFHNSQYVSIDFTDDVFVPVDTRYISRCSFQFVDSIGNPVIFDSVDFTYLSVNLDIRSQMPLML